jgi:hypothetical protein
MFQVKVFRLDNIGFIGCFFISWTSPLKEVYNEKQGGSSRVEKRWGIFCFVFIEAVILCVCVQFPFALRKTK